MDPYTAFFVGLVVDGVLFAAYLLIAAYLTGGGK
jgi:hypothetical protein